MSTRGILLGGLTGGLVGAVVRGNLTFYNLQAGEFVGFMASLPSFGIGFLCGAIAGGFCRVWLDALLGAVLSAGVFGLFVLPLGYLVSGVEGVGKVGSFTWIYFAQKAIAGAIGGGTGGFVGRQIVVSERKAAGDQK